MGICFPCWLGAGGVGQGTDVGVSLSSFGRRLPQQTQLVGYAQEIHPLAPSSGQRWAVLYME